MNRSFSIYEYEAERQKSAVPLVILTYNNYNNYNLGHDHLASNLYSGGSFHVKWDDGPRTSSSDLVQFFLDPKTKCVAISENLLI